MRAITTGGGRQLALGKVGLEEGAATVSDRISWCATIGVVLLESSVFAVSVVGALVWMLVHWVGTCLATADFLFTFFPISAVS